MLNWMYLQVKCLLLIIQTVVALNTCNGVFCNGEFWMEYCISIRLYYINHHNLASHCTNRYHGIAVPRLSPPVSARERHWVCWLADFVTLRSGSYAQTANRWSRDATAVRAPCCGNDRAGGAGSVAFLDTATEWQSLHLDKALFTSVINAASRDTAPNYRVTWEKLCHVSLFKINDLWFPLNE